MIQYLLLSALMALASASTVIQQHSSSAWGSSVDGATVDRGSVTFQGTSSDQQPQLASRSSFGSRRAPTQRRTDPAFSRPLPDMNQLLGGLRPGQPLFQPPNIHGLVQQALGASLARGTAAGDVTSGQQQTIDGGVSQVNTVRAAAEGEAQNGGSSVGHGSASDGRRWTVSGQDSHSDTSATSVQRSGSSPDPREYPRW